MFVDVHASQKRCKENFADCIANCVKWLSTSWNFCNLLQEFLKLLICDRWSQTVWEKWKKMIFRLTFTTTVSLSILSFCIFLSRNVVKISFTLFRMRLFHFSASPAVLRDSSEICRLWGVNVLIFCLSLYFIAAHKFRKRTCNAADGENWLSCSNASRSRLRATN